MAILAISLITGIRVNTADTTKFDVQLDVVPLGGLGTQDQFWAEAVAKKDLSVDINNQCAAACKTFLQTTQSITFGATDSVRVLASAL